MTTNRATAAKGSFPYPNRHCGEWSLFEALDGAEYCTYVSGGKRYIAGVQQSGFVDLPPRNICQAPPAKSRRPKGEAKREWGME